MLKVSFSASTSSGGGCPTGLNDLGLVIMLMTASVACCNLPWAIRRATLASVTWTDAVAMSSASLFVTVVA